jgi:hypothetical protein
MRYFINSHIATPIAPALINQFTKAGAIIYLEVPRSPGGYFKPLLGPGGTVVSEGKDVSVPEAKWI